MKAILDVLFAVTYGVYRVVRAAFRFVDFLASVVWSAISNVFLTALRLAVVVLIQVLVFRGIHFCFFPVELSPDFGLDGVRLAKFAASYPVLIAFTLFFVGETIAVVISFALVRAMVTFRLEYIFESDKIDREGRPYSPFDEESSAASDPLSF